MTDLSEQSVKSLRLRQSLGRWILKLFRTELRHEYDAEKVQAAEATYREQLQAINDELRKRRQARREALGEELPEAPRVQMRPAVLGTKARNKEGNGTLADKLKQELEARDIQVEVRDG